MKERKKKGSPVNLPAVIASKMWDSPSAKESTRWGGVSISASNSKGKTIARVDNKVWVQMVEIKWKG